MKKGDELIVDVMGFNSKGKGIAKTDKGLVIFVDKVLPGDKVKIKLKRKKSKYAEADLVEILNESEDRITPRCNYFGICGGCNLQNCSYDKQIEFKIETVRNAFEKIGRFSKVEVPIAIKSEDIFFYRNKMEFSFSDDKWLQSKPTKNDIEQKNENNFALGLHVPKFHSKIVDIEECLLQSNISNDILNLTRGFFKEKGASIYSTRTYKGYLRFLIIRQCKNTNDIMLNLITYDFDEILVKEFSKKLSDTFPEITTFVNSTSKSKAQVAFGEEEKVIYGKGYIFEKLNRDGKDFKFEISPNSFFQTNTLQTEKLYKIVSDFGEFKESDNVLDLYSGAGTIAIYISDFVSKVMGVELLEDAVANAKENAAFNDVMNTEFFSSDIRDFVLNLKKNEQDFFIYKDPSNEDEFINKIILDPPRSGVHPKVCEVLSETKFDKIVYVSCNPVTQARDLEIICGKGKFEIEKIQPIDMFPQTYHIENVVCLKNI